MKTSTKILCALGVLLAGCGSGGAPSAAEPSEPAEPPPPPPRAIVLIVVDTLRRDHLSCYGYERETSPNLDRLAADSTRYAHAVSQAPWTTPSIGALLTSQYPSMLGITTERSMLEPDRLLLAEVLGEHGYATGAAVSHSFCSSQWGFDQGFASFDDSMAGIGISSPEITEKGLAFIREHRGKPFFLWLHYFDPHWAYLAHEGLDFADERDPDYHGPVWSGMDMSEIKDRAKAGELEPGDIREMVRLYDSEVAFTDEHIGRILDELRDSGLYDDTLIAFLADHGEEFGGRGRFGHAGSLYAEVTNVPLIVHYPGQAPGVVEEPVASVDVFPTILERSGIEVPADAVGTSLWPPTRTPDHLVFSETERGASLRSVVRGDRKLIKNLKTGRFELFDLSADPRETKNLWSETDPDAVELRAALEGWIEDLAGRERAAREATVSEEEAERLRAIGYTGE